jgi:hypothetical protein
LKQNNITETSTPLLKHIIPYTVSLIETTTPFFHLNTVSFSDIVLPFNGRRDKFDGKRYCAIGTAKSPKASPKRKPTQWDRLLGTMIFSYWEAGCALKSKHILTIDRHHVIMVDRRETLSATVSLFILFPSDT